MRRLTLSGLVIALAVMAVLSPPMQQSSSALTGWKAGRIIDDSVFTANTSMSTPQIQSFLNLKVPSCDTNGAKNSEMNNSGVPDYNGNGSIQRWEWGKKKYNQTIFTCLKNYTKDGKKASQIIYEKSQKYKISPKVLLVLLQKEQSLVTDTWPLSVQYRTATGYGCPDTAPCASEYFGLANQLDWAAKMFRAIIDNSPTWYTPYELGNNYIQYSPDSSCGGSVVNIENRSTQALYNYTPYQPNKAARDAGWGTASCGAYGNRNFYLYFTEWFGSVRGTNFSYLIQCSGIYYIGDSVANKKYPITADGIEDWGINSSDALVDNYICSSPTATTDITNIVRSTTTGKLYLVDMGNAYPLINQATASDWGITDISASSHPSISGNILNQYLSVAGDLPILGKTANPTRSDVYLIDDEKRYRVAGSDIAETSTTRLISGDSSIRQRTISVDLLQTFAADATLGHAFTSGGKTYLFDFGKLFEVSTAATALWTSHIGASNIVSLSGSMPSLFAKSSIGTSFQKDGYFYQLLGDNDFRRTTSSRVAANWSTSFLSFTRLLRDKVLDGATVSSHVDLPVKNNVRLISCSGQKYIVERYIRVKRLLTPYAETAWGFNAYYFYVNDPGCSYPSYTMPLDNAVRSRSSKMVYYISAKKAYPVPNESVATSYGIGNPATTTFPYMESESILDNLTIVR